MSRNLFSEQISKPFCQLYVGFWKFHFLTSSCFPNCMLVCWKYHFLTSSSWFPTVCWFVWKFTSVLLLSLGSCTKFSKSICLTNVVGCLLCSKQMNQKNVTVCSQCHHVDTCEMFLFGFFFTSREGGRDHPL